VVELALNPVHKGLLLSASSDGTVLLWNCFPTDVPFKTPLCCFQCNALNLAWTSDGTGFISGGYAGVMKHWTVPAHLLEDKEKEKKSVRGKGTPTKKGEEEVLVVKDFKKLEKKHLCDIGNSIISRLPHPHLLPTSTDCVRCYDGKCVTKSVDGRIYVWDVSTEEVVHTLKVPNCSGSTRSLLDLHHSAKGSYLCAGILPTPHLYTTN